MLTEHLLGIRPPMLGRGEPHAKGQREAAYHDRAAAHEVQILRVLQDRVLELGPSHEVLQVEALHNLLGVAVHPERAHPVAHVLPLVPCTHAALPLVACHRRHIAPGQGQEEAGQAHAEVRREMHDLAEIDEAELAILEQQDVSWVGVSVEDAVPEDLLAVDGEQGFSDLPKVEDLSSSTAAPPKPPPHAPQRGLPANDPRTLRLDPALAQSPQVVLFVSFGVAPLAFGHGPEPAPHSVDQLLALEELHAEHARRAEFWEGLRHADAAAPLRQQGLPNGLHVALLQRVVELARKHIFDGIHVLHRPRQREGGKKLQSPDVCTKEILDAWRLHLHRDLLACRPKPGPEDLADGRRAQWFVLPLDEDLGDVAIAGAREPEFLGHEAAGIDPLQHHRSLILKSARPLQICLRQEVVAHRHDLRCLQIKASHVSGRPLDDRRVPRMQNLKGRFPCLCTRRPTLIGGEADLVHVKIMRIDWKDEQPELQTSPEALVDGNSSRHKNRDAAHAFQGPAPLGGCFHDRGPIAATQTRSGGRQSPAGRAGASQSQHKSGPDRVAGSRRRQGSSTHDGSEHGTEGRQRVRSRAQT
mmetsp:Transcript_44568/g.125895  ORF Transcript_44568/g.125895 Transcript_44568/m.125895 type:complete len:585 (-) Transcript_44568:12-1766(-)